MIAVFLMSLPLAPSSPAGEVAPVRLTLQPMTASKPVMKYLLLPEVRELTPGNPVQWYLRSFAEQRGFFFQKESVEWRAKYRSMPLAELRALKLQTYGGSALTQADWGARLDTPDWTVLDRVKTEGTALTQPELEPLWVLATSLQVRFRIEVAEAQFEEAIRSAKTMFALARHLGECPTMAANLLGVSVANLVLDTLEEMIGQPGCPNLYWAFTDLPCPLVDLRKGVQADRVMAAKELEDLQSDVAMTEGELEDLVGRLSGRTGIVREQSGRPLRGLRARLAERLKETGRVGAARARLLNGIPAGGLREKVLALRVMAFPLN